MNKSTTCNISRVCFISNLYVERNDRGFDCCIAVAVRICYVCAKLIATFMMNKTNENINKAKNIMHFICTHNFGIR